MATGSADEQFERIDWESLDGGRRGFATRTKVFLAGTGLLAVLFAYDLLVLTRQEEIFGRLDPERITWLFVLSLLAFACFVVVPLVTDRKRTRRYWRRLRSNNAAVASLLYLVCFLLVGTFGPLAFAPDIEFSHASQPPLLFSVDSLYPLYCLGEISNGLCHGTLRYPLGTNADGKGVLRLIVAGFRVSLVVALVTSMLLVPLATGVGLLAGYRGGWTDRLLMGYVDVQQTVPSFVVYLVLIFLFHTSLFLVVLVFGLTSWGSAARLVRSEVIQRREEPYVVAARNAGASDFHVIRHHILPNVSSTVVTAVTRQIPTLLLAEAAIAYMELNDIMIQSFGETIAYGLRGDWQTVWWPVVFPVAAFSLTVVAFSVFGDALRDVLDPRGDV